MSHCPKYCWHQQRSKVQVLPYPTLPDLAPIFPHAGTVLCWTKEQIKSNTPQRSWKNNLAKISLIYRLGAMFWP